MNILHVVSSFTPCFSHGGVVNASYEIAKAQVRDGHNVTVFTTDNCKERLNVKDNVNLDGINVHYFRNISNSFKNTFTIDSPLKLNSTLKKEISSFDIIHIHEHRHTLAILTVKHALKQKIPYVLQSHGSVLPFFQKESLKKIFDKLWGFKILHNASKVFALTEVEKEQYLKMGILEDKIEIVPLGINLKDYENLPSKGNFRLKHNFSNDSKLLLFLGRIHEIKGLDLAIESLNLLKNEDYKLAIVGEDYGFKSTLEKLIKKYSIEDKVIFTGPLYKNDKKEALIDCDVFLMPSRYESFTTSGLEAMACSTPLILTNNNHICSWVNNNVGICCNYDKKELSIAINELLDNVDLMDKFSKKGLELVKTKYNWNIIDKNIIQIYNDVIKLK
ncbi:glycosyltransferase [Methanobrevibacter sp. DSM 116169]|uniref:glycosyltransferase n=1 Tax=Methanobrevibacter sp. DSM 116169 TaxID=3242727 RepID=UPI0038FCA147